MTSDNNDAGLQPPGTVFEVFTAFLKLGLTSFGGPVAHIGYFRRELVERRAWVSETQFGQLLAICQFLPGPASSQLGFTLGMLRAGWTGALAAFVAFTLPSVLVLVAFAASLSSLDNIVAGAAVQGLKIVALAVVADGVLGMARNFCGEARRATIAALAAAAILIAATASAQLVVIAVGAILGYFLCRDAHLDSADTIRVGYTSATAGFLMMVFFMLMVYLAINAADATSHGVIADIFYRTGALVFGGGHVVLPLLETAVVDGGWIDESTFLAGYGASQAIPGPLFSFAAFLGALMPGNELSFTGAALATLMIFLPGFLLVASVLPLWSQLSAWHGAAPVVAGVNAAVVGILGAALYDPILTSAVRDMADLGIGIVGFVLLRAWGLSALWVVGWCVLASVAIAVLA